MDGERRINFQLAAFTLATLTVVLSASQASVHADEVVGLVSETTGVARIQRAGSTLAVNRGTAVMVHDQVTTEPDSTVILKFPDGSSLSLAAASSVAIDEAELVGGNMVPSRVTLLSGNIHASVPDKTTGASRKMEVDTPNAKANSAH
jgi:hypothetical protein